MRRFNLRERKIIEKFVKLDIDKNRLKLPTISAYLTDIYFEDNSNSFLAIINGQGILFVKSTLSIKEKNECIYSVFEMLFLLKKLEKLNYVNFPPLFSDTIDSFSTFMKKCYTDASHNPQTNCVTFSGTGDYLRGDSFNIHDSNDNVIFVALKITGYVNDIMREIIPAGVFISEDLKILADNSFISPEEMYSRTSLSMSRWGIGIAIIIGLVSILVGSASLYYSAKASTMTTITSSQNVPAPEPRVE